MSYTPTTEQIRKSYAVSRSENLGQTLKRAKAFDAWLAAHDAEVAATALEELSALVARKGAEWDRQSGEHAAGMSHAASKIRVYISEQIAAQKRGV